MQGKAEEEGRVGSDKIPSASPEARPGESGFVRRDIAHEFVLPRAESVSVPKAPRVGESLEELSGQTRSTSEALVQVLINLGVEYAFGIVGGAIAPFCEKVSKSPINLLHFRHESGAAFAAVEASITSGRPVVVFATTGPGLINSLTGIFAARWEGAKVILISGATPPLQRGKWAFQETSLQALPASFFTAGSLFHYAVTMEHPGELEVIASRLASGLTRPSGFVAHLSLPLGVQTAPCEKMPRASLSSIGPPVCDFEAITECARMLEEGSFVIWAGFGARHASREVRILAERAGARVMCSPRAKGVFPESHPLYLGNTGIGGNPAAELHMRTRPPEYLLVLGTRLGEGTSAGLTHLPPTKGIVHVDIETDSFGIAYPGVNTIGVHAETKTFLTELLNHFEPTSRKRIQDKPQKPPLEWSERAVGRVRPQALMQAIQKIVVDGSDAVVFAEAGNSAVWGNRLLRFEQAGRYRVSTGFGSMGQGVTGVVGAAAVTGKKAVAIVGDGAMLMFNEVNTAVQYNTPAVWIVLNDGQYGMIEQGMRGLGLVPTETAIPHCDFVQWAKALGANGIRVEHEMELSIAIRLAMKEKGPFVVDVQIDETELAPFAERVKTILEQGVQE